MRKTLLSLFVLGCIGISCIYVFIPGNKTFTETIFVKVKQVNANRFIIDQNNWMKWWPNQGNSQIYDTIQKANHYYNGNTYVVNVEMTQGDSVLIHNDKQYLITLINIIPHNADSVMIEWKGQTQFAINPVRRVTNYLHEKEVTKDIKGLLQNMKIFMENEENLYGIRIEHLQVKDTILIATRDISESYPSTDKIYNIIQSLKNYTGKYGATQTDYPMLNVTEDSGRFRTMIALPINKAIAENNTFLLKKMVAGKILKTEVKGGRYESDKALAIIETYMNDHHLLSPAIPFQSLVTDRSKESDSTKWITWIYYPVM